VLQSQNDAVWLMDTHVELRRQPPWSNDASHALMDPWSMLLLLLLLLLGVRLGVCVAEVVCVGVGVGVGVCVGV
jgi:hypothetical protein